MNITIERPPARPPVWIASVFDHILCGVDGTESSRVAVAQAVRLLPPRRVLELVSVVEEDVGFGAPPMDDAELRRRFGEARDAISTEHAQFPRARSRLLVGDPGAAIVAFARQSRATLAVVGAPASGRLGGAILGRVGIQLLHTAPCSVLVARSTAEEAAFPRSVLVGYDGSPADSTAVAVARELAHRFDADLRILAPSGAVPALNGTLTRQKVEWPAAPVADALIAESERSDLLVVTGRGVRAAGGLEQVAERVGQLARCSVLIIREPASPHVIGNEDAVPDDEC